MLQLYEPVEFDVLEKERRMLEKEGKLDDIDLDNPNMEIQNAIESQILLVNEQTRDEFIEMINLCDNYNRLRFIPNQEIFKMALEKTSVTLTELLNNCNFETKGTQFIAEVDWPHN